MTKTKNTKRALLMSALSLLMCVSMLIGSTFAWFTDSVTSKNNKIQAGTLDIQLLMDSDVDGNYDDISNSPDPIFGAGSIASGNNAETLWEPGKTQVAYLAIKNNGNLALKYKVALFVDNVKKDIYKVMQYAIVPDADVNNKVASWTSGNSVAEGMQTVAADVPLAVGATHYFALAIHMNEEAGNEYQGGEVDFDLAVQATQDTIENDSFDNQYDADAKYPLLEAKIVETAFGNYMAKVKIPAGAPGGNYDLEIPQDKVKLTNNAEQASLNFDMSLLNEGNKVSGVNVEYPVTIYLPHPFVDDVKVLHNGEPVDIKYDSKTQAITFVTTHFSLFEIQLKDYVNPSSELKYDENTWMITKGTFLANPVDAFVENLGVTATINPSCTVVDYEKDGVTYYDVCEKDSFVLVSNDTTLTSYEGETATYPVTYVSSDKLYTVFAAGYRTVYLMPGTYKTATTLTVSTDMDIIGLGDTGAVKIEKLGVHSDTTKRPSNRHLFNCTNSDPNTYIEVAIRNLSLKATEKNSYYTENKWFGKQLKEEDNAAVQAIRRAKVKCYDLIVEKIANDASSIAFYVNSTNKANDGKTYPAYMYVENTVVNSQNVNGVADAKSMNSYFYYNNLTYNGGTTQYAATGSNIENTAMKADDWNW